MTDLSPEPRPESAASRVIQLSDLLGREPGNAAAWNDLGNLLLDMESAAEAEECFRRAIALSPDMPVAQYNLARLLQLTGRQEQALLRYETLLDGNPDFPEPAYNRAVLLANAGRLDAATVAYRGLLGRFPGHAHAWNNLGKLLREQGEAEAATAAFREASRNAPADAEIASNHLFCMLHSPSTSREQLVAAQQAYAARFESPCAASWPRHDNIPDPRRPLRLGFVSPDLREHPVGRFLEPLLQRLDRQSFTVVCYSCFDSGDERAARLRSLSDAWRPLAGLDDAASAQIIRDDGIDILLDLAGHTAGNRLGIFARNPAPVQITWLGYLGSTGLSAMGWRLTDPWADPPGLGESLHSEKLLRLPVSQWCYQAPADALPPLGRLAGQDIVFGSFNNIAKLSDQLLLVWREILSSSPRTRLLVAGVPPGSGRERIARTLDAGERLRMVDRCSPAEYMALFRQVDIALDSYPYAGGTTTCDAFWMGVPVLTLVGERTCARSGASLLHALGMGDWVAGSAEEYIGIALKWSGNPGELAALKAELRARMARSPLMDAALFTCHWQDAVRLAWRLWCESPDRCA